MLGPAAQHCMRRGGIASDQVSLTKSSWLIATVSIRKAFPGCQKSVWTLAEFFRVSLSVCVAHHADLARPLARPHSLPLLSPGDGRDFKRADSTPQALGS